MSERTLWGADAWQGPGDGFLTLAQGGDPTTAPSPSATSPNTATVAGRGSRSTAGAQFTADPQQLRHLADDVEALSQECLAIRQDLPDTSKALPSGAFGSIAESEDTYLTYAKRVEAASQEFETAKLDLHELSERLLAAAVGYTAQDRRAADDYSSLGDPPPATPGSRSRTG